MCRCNETFYEFSFFCEIGHWVELANSVAGGGCVHRWGVIDILLSGWAASELVRAEHAGGLRCTDHRFTLMTNTAFKSDTRRIL